MEDGPSRFIPLQGCFNFRDLGGYRTADGRHVKWRRLFRSEALHHLTPSDIVKVQEELGIITALDLRNPEEIQQDGAMAWSTASYYNLPFLGARQLAPPDPEADPVARLTEIYQWVIRNAGNCIAESLNILAQSNNLPAVFHCTAGKDRTGILASVLLGVLGVDHDQIMADYILTNEVIDRLGIRLRARPGNESRPLNSFRAQPEAMELVLAELAEEHGGTTGYVRSHGVTDATMQMLKDSMLE